MLGRKMKTFYIILIIIVGLAVGFFIIESKKDTIHYGVKIEGIDVAELTKQEAFEKVKFVMDNKYKDSELKFVDKDQIYAISYKELGYSLDINGAVDKAYAFGRSNIFIRNFFDILSGPIRNKDIKIEESYMPQSISQAINYLVEKVYKEPVNSKVSYTKEEGFKFTKSERGAYLDSKKLKELIYNNISKKETIELPVLNSNPTISSEAFEGITGLLSEFSTNYSKSEENRKDNIDLGASKFNDKIVKSGEEVSFNDTVGSINSLNGFKESGVIVNGEFDRGVGGGICQVSTTLYNALVRADLEITERHNHSRPIGYVDLGTDAAVSEGYKNLKFRNNLKTNIYIKAFTDRKEIKFQIFGNKEERDYEVKIVPKLLGVVEPKIITEYSKDIEEGKTEIKKKGAKGYSYETYKDIIKDGQVVSSDKISSSRYISRDEIVVIGEGKPQEDKNNDKDLSNNQKKQ